jgi:hypothetical protein
MWGGILRMKLRCILTLGVGWITRWTFRMGGGRFDYIQYIRSGKRVSLDFLVGVRDPLFPNCFDVVSRCFDVTPPVEPTRPRTNPPPEQNPGFR